MLNTKKQINNKLDMIYYFLLACSLMFYKQNYLLNIFIVIFVSILFLMNINKDSNFIFSYFALIFFEPILVLPFGGGSFFKIYQIIFLLRFIFDVINRKKYKFHLVLNTIAGIVFMISSIFYVGSIETLLSTITNTLLLIYIIIIINQDEVGRELFYSKILGVVGIFTALSGVYGMLHSNALDYGYTMRFGATIGDPNYSSLFYTLGLFSLIGSDAISKTLKRILIFILCLSLLLTVSISGIVGTFLLFVLFVSIKKLNKGIIIGVSILVAFAVFINVSLKNGTALYGLQFRILSMLNSSDLDIITSNRFYIARSYIDNFQTLPLGNQLFGGNNTISGEFRDMMVGLFANVAHNSYIDMLYMIGIIGTIFIVFLFTVMIIKCIRQYKLNNKVIYLSIALLKLTILYYATSISIFPFRYFYTFFIL